MQFSCQSSAQFSNIPMRTLNQTYLEYDMGMLQMIASTVGLVCAIREHRRRSERFRFVR